MVVDMTGFQEKVLWSRENGIINIIVGQNIKQEVIDKYFKIHPYFVIYNIYSASDIIEKMGLLIYESYLDIVINGEIEMKEGFQHILLNSGVQIFDLNIYLGEKANTK